MLLSVSDAKARRKWHQKVLTNHWTVRDLDEALREDKAQGSSPSGKNKSAKKGHKGGGSHVVAEEARLGPILGTKVAVMNTGPKGRGKIIIEFYSAEDYDRISRVIVGGGQD